ncbi:hypothetical protein OOJ09_12885 [Mesorhizobium qingshengii]|uniref:Sulfotransferase family protein n=1 Tax=Mesorhizobium qingshengii TaxID=1165689 RepID=A0ABT4QU43_9HYPH|nr:hypothetical protein [Mesorhizobium qingshengii]MCZ8545082.1 hypothetical protein [Mesorhizobium qingshengii]
MQRPIFFCHIPKTAGTVLRLAFDRSFAPDTVFPTEKAITENQGQYPETQDAMAMVRQEVEKVRLFRGHYAFPASRALRNPIVVILLREPIARTKSHIRHVVRNGQISQAEAFAALDAGRLPDIVPANLMTYMLSHSDTPRLSEALSTVAAAEYLGVTENLGPFLERLKAIGIEAPNEQHNVGDDDIRFTPDQAETIRRHNETDAELYTGAIVDLFRRHGYAPPQQKRILQ